MDQLAKKPKVGYVAAILSQEARELLDAWVRKIIPDKALFTAEINGVLEGGNVARKAHLTLFFGIDDDVIKKRVVKKLIDSIVVPELKVREINSFKISNIPCKILHLVVDDSDGKLQAIHNLLSTLPHFADKQEPNFVPHITLAYVKDSFDEHSLRCDNLGKLKVKEVVYQMKA